MPGNRQFLILAGAWALTTSVANVARAADDAGFEALQSDYRTALMRGAPWTAAGIAERAASLPGISAAQKVLALREAARQRRTLGDLRRAREELGAALALAGADDQTLTALARLSRDTPAAALDYAERAALAAPAGWRKAEALRLAGETRLALGDSRGARRNLERALADSPNDLDALRSLALASRDAAILDLALSAAERAPSWRRSAAFRFCARICLELGDDRKAVVTLRRAIRFDPDDLDAWEMLAPIGRRYPDALEATPGAPPAADGAPSDGLEALRSRFAYELAAGRRADAVRLAQEFSEAIPDAPAWQQPAALLLSARNWRELGDRQAAWIGLLRAWAMDFDAMAPAKLMEDFVAAGLAGNDRLYAVDLDAITYSDPLQGVHGDADANWHLARGYIRKASLQRGLQDSTGAEESTREAVAYARRLVKVLGSVAGDARVSAFHHASDILRNLMDRPELRPSVETALAAVPQDPDALEDAVVLASAAGRRKLALDFATQRVARLANAPSGARAAALRQLEEIQAARGADASRLSSDSKH